MNLENKSTDDLKQLHTDICTLCNDIDEMEVTAGNKEQIRDVILQRLHNLPLPSPYDEMDLHPHADATVRAEIDQMTAKLTALKTELEARLADG